jgi:methionyl-tRNA formyltransferase
MTVEALDLIAAGRAKFVEQDDSQATFAPALKKSSGIVNWSKPAGEIKDLVRAVNPWPLASTWYYGSGPPRRVILLEVESLDCDAAVETRVAPARRSPPAGGREGAGEVIRSAGDGPVVAAGRGCVLLRRVKPPGGREMDGAAYARGHGILVGGRFGRQPDAG